MHNLYNAPFFVKPATRYAKWRLGLGQLDPEQMLYQPEGDVFIENPSNDDVINNMIFYDIGQVIVQPTYNTCTETCFVMLQNFHKNRLNKMRHEFTPNDEPFTRIEKRLAHFSLIDEKFQQVTPKTKGMGSLLKDYKLEKPEKFTLGLDSPDLAGEMRFLLYLHGPLVIVIDDTIGKVPCAHALLLCGIKGNQMLCADSWTGNLIQYSVADFINDYRSEFFYKYKGYSRQFVDEVFALKRFNRRQGLGK